MEIPTWSFLVIAIIFAIVIGRAGTLLRELFESRQFGVVPKKKRLKVASCDVSTNTGAEHQSRIYQK